MDNDMPDVNKQIQINFPIRISMSGYSIKDNHGRMLFKMEMSGDNWKNHKKIEQFLSDAEQIVNLVNANQQLIKEAEERRLSEIKDYVSICKNTKGWDRIPFELHVEIDRLFSAILKAEGE